MECEELTLECEELFYNEKLFYYFKTLTLECEELENFIRKITDRQM